MSGECGEAAPLRLVGQTGSTNDDARSLAAAGAPAGTAVAARRQTAGRGRRGHAWESPAGGLYLSVVLRPPVPMSFFVGLPAVCALGALAALRDNAGLAGAALKWPNDVLLGDGKLAGILVEAGSGADGPYAVCGIGVNLEPVPAGAGSPAFDGPSPLPRACVVDGLPAGAEPPSFEGLAEALRTRIVEAVDAWGGEVNAGRALAGPLAPVLDAYCNALPMLGGPVEVVGPEGAGYGLGIFMGVDCWGRATVRMADGREEVLSSEQASLRRFS